MIYAKELEFAKALALEAGEIMRRYFNAADIGTEWKDDNTPLTVADTKINDLVIKKCREIFPDYGVLGEEASYEPGCDKLWVVDPIDGTIPFAHGLPVSTFMLALVIEGNPVIGVIYDPVLDQLYSASKDGGAYLNQQKIHVSKKPELFNSLVDITYRQGQNVAKDLSGLWERAAAAEIKALCLKSIGYSGTLVAAGKLTGVVFGMDKPWDGAAVQIIVDEAGGKVTDLDGKPRLWNQPGKGYIASNGLTHSELLKLINQT